MVRNAVILPWGDVLPVTPPSAFWLFLLKASVHLAKFVTAAKRKAVANIVTDLIER